MKKALVLFLVLGVSVLAVQGCGKSGNYPDSTLVNELVYFDSDKYNLKPEALRALDYKVGYLKHFPGKTIFVVGHTDRRSSDKYNLDLGRHRAEEIQRYLVNNGINPKRIVLMTEGKRRLADPANTTAADTRNRRAEFFIVGVNNSN
ncbi:MAG: OmpA family protein [Candidatus Adiutrix sp.]|jgi:outer membrane protein OmpA-like peptidoglycan-associated protein|nr:OmpA family protein [Candidatus Adiutrix sp.]